MKLRTIGPKVRLLDTRKVKVAEKTADPHYSTPEHRAWRAKVVAKAHGRCQDPAHVGSHEPGIRLFADHIKELRDGGDPFAVSNGMARCGACHSRKTAAARQARLRTS